ncbi:hypothetical protein SEPCBS119000_003373 [Sporothrix epigloea]|uniref:Peroxin/Ferlin domain-containing protein n=1 Tax=Sporothrix epigloea TaxID=1892477 RepID=A0ABP0DN20_9PEZI
MPKPRSSRRASPLKDSDYDHEITLVDTAAGGTGAGSANASSRQGVANANNQAPSTSAIPVTNNTHEASDGAASEATSRRPSEMASMPGHEAILSPVDTANSLTPLLETASSAPAAPGSDCSTSRGRDTTRYGSISNVLPAPANGAPAVQIEDATPEGDAYNGSGRQHQFRPVYDQPGPEMMESTQPINLEEEAAIDILYENERGGFLCGIALFSRQALGNLDPSPWTNYAHGTSPTDIHNAQVPDPTWEWAWPAWRINHDDDGHEDKDGWEYSFMFSKWFSWHGPTWYSSCVRRRAWSRKRVKRTSTSAMSAAASAIGLGQIDSCANPQLLNPEYFTVLPAASARRSSSGATSRRDSRRDSRRTSRTSLAAPGLGTEGGRRSTEEEEDDGSLYRMPKEIANADVLMNFLRVARIDREKIEAVDKFIESADDDLVRLQDFMHEIMALFVFQASRQTLLTHLTEAHDAAVAARQKANDDAVITGVDRDKSNQADKADGAAGAAVALSSGEVDTKQLQGLGRRAGYLAAAVKHADEEVRRLEYWSDIKTMAQRGATVGAVGGNEDWDAHQWQGIDSSGPIPPPEPPKQAGS